MTRMGVIIICFLCALASMPSAVHGIILHDSSEPVSRPSDGVVGRWGGNASCVVINANHVLSTRHQNGFGSGLGTTVAISGSNYKVVQETNIASDIRVARLTTTDGQFPNLSDDVPLYTRSSENGKTLIIGGFGKVRGADLQTGGVTYGYLWASNPGNQLHWGANKIGAVDNEYLLGDFDDVGQGGHVQYEAIPAEYDSGGGWFIWQSNKWKLAGLTKGVEHLNMAWFRNSSDPGILDPDGFSALRVRTYASDIDDVIGSSEIISGFVSESNKPVQNIRIEAASGDMYTQTDSDGYYELWVPSGWSGTVGPVEAMVTFNPSSVSYSNVTGDISDEDYTVDVVLVDDFNDNKRSSTWRIEEDDRSLLWLDETAEHLQIQSVDEANYTESGYVSNGWGLNPSSSFSLKIDFHNEIIAEQASWVSVKLSPAMSGDDYISFEAGSAESQRHWQYEQVADGNVVADSNSARTSNDGTIFVSYNTGSDELYLSYNGYGSSSDWQSIPGLLQGSWGGGTVYIEIGGGSADIDISSGQMYLDNFIINTADLSDWPPVTDINGDGFIDFLDIKMLSQQWLNVGEGWEADIDGSERVDFKDFAEFAEIW